MSSMLEQAIVDAKALKESAIKNAEAIVVEKYSDQIKEAVSALLEQDEDDPFAEEDFVEPSPVAVDVDAASAPSLNQVPPSLEENIPDGNGVTTSTDVISLDLNQIRQEISNIENANGVAPESVVTHETVAQNLEPAVAASPEPVSTLSEEKEEELEEEIEIDESLLEDILERLTVDIDPQMSGWAGTPQSQMEEYADMALARENDDKVKEENEALRSRLEELKESLKKNTDQKEKLAEENSKFMEAVIILKEKVDIVNVSNAKLLYINKALENSSLNERQKRKIVEAISKAETTKEAKVIYETLQSTVGSTEKRSVPKSLSEAVSRNSSLLIHSQRNREKDSTDPFSERLQRLAGIKKTKT
jgi:hypothetical protein